MTLHSGEKIAAILRHPTCTVSQRKCAEAAKMSEANFRYHIEDGNFTLDQLARICAALNVDADTILPDSLLNIATPGGRA